MDDAKPDSIAPEVEDAFDEYQLFDADEPGIFDELDEEEEAASSARAEADLAAGRVIPHKDVVEWLESLMTDNPLPRPRPWLK